MNKKNKKNKKKSMDKSLVIKISIILLIAIIVLVGILAYIYFSQDSTSNRDTLSFQSQDEESESIQGRVLSLGDDSIQIKGFVLKKSSSAQENIDFKEYDIVVDSQTILRKVYPNQGDLDNKEADLSDLEMGDLIIIYSEGKIREDKAQAVEIHIMIFDNIYGQIKQVNEQELLIEEISPLQGMEPRDFMVTIDDDTEIVIRDYTQNDLESNDKFEGFKPVDPTESWGSFSDIEKGDLVFAYASDPIEKGIEEFKARKIELVIFPQEEVPTSF